MPDVQSPAHGGRDYLLVVLAALIPYLNTLTNGFVLDDVGQILLNKAVRSFDLYFLFTSDYWAGFEGRQSGLYRPLTSLSFALEHRLWGETPTFFHLTNLILHAGNCLLVCSLGRSLGGKSLGLLTGLLFAVHPVHTEAVAGIAGRADLLAALAILAALRCSLAARLGSADRYRTGSTLFLILGLLCKENAAVLPGLLLGADWFLWKRGRLPRWPWSEYALHLLTITSWLLLRQAVLGGLTVPQIDFLDNPLAHLPTHLRIVNALDIAVRYLFLLLFPHPLSADYSFDAVPLIRALFVPDLFSAAGLLIAVALALRSFWSCPALWSLGIFWLLIGLVPVANLLLPIGTIMAERLLYLPSVGFALASGAILIPLLCADRKAWKLLLLLLLLLYAGRTAVRNRDWRDDESLFRAVVEAHPRSAKARQGLAAALSRRGDVFGAVAEYRRAIAIHPPYAAAHYNLGLTYWKFRQYDSALESFREAVRLKPQNPKALLNIGATYYQLRRLPEAEEAYRRAIEINPGYLPAWQNLADLYYEQGDFIRAARAYRELLRLQPDHPERPDFEARILQEGQ